MNARTDFAVAAALLALALLIGGAGVTFPGLQALLQLAAIAAAAYFLLTPRRWRFRGLCTFALILAGLAVLLPAAQLVPLPPSLWQQLPGRDLPARLDAALGWTVWRPLTLDVESTIRAMLTALPAAALFLACAFLTITERHRLLWIVVILSLASGLLGIVQVATGGAFTPFRSAHTGYPIGLFVNRNHNAALCLVAIPIVAMLAATEVTIAPLARRIAAMGALVIFSLVIVATTSRMAMLLLPIALASALFLLFLGQSLWRVAFPSVLALGALIVILFASGAFDPTLMRFSSLHDSRFDYWADVHWALGHYGLAGTGIGAFIPVYKSAESLGGISSAMLNHAHNDYLELLLGGGWPAILLLLGFLGFLVAAAVRLVRSRATGQHALTALASLIGIVLILAYSLVDYPIRMPAISCVFAVLCAALLPETCASAKPRAAGAGARLIAGRPAGATVVRAACLVLLGLLAGLALQAAMSGRALLRGDPATAASWAPWSTTAYEDRATTALLKSRDGAARRDASTALRLSPISAPAIRTIAVLRLLEGRQAAGNRLMDLAASLGWRDRITQVWAINAAIAGEPDKAVQRSEALFRQNLFPPAVLHLLLRAPARRETVPLLVGQLALQPSWRDGFFREGAKMPTEDIAPFVDIFDGLKRGSGPPSIQETKGFVARLIDAGEIERARHLWTLTHAAGNLANGGFDVIADPGTPAYWDMPESGPASASVAIPPFAAGDALRIYGSGSRQAVLSQRLLLRPGRYELSFLAAAETPSDTALQWELRCQGASNKQELDFAPAPLPRWQPMRANLTVPSQDCPIQRLALKLAGGTNPATFWLDDIRMRRTLVNRSEK